MANPKDCDWIAPHIKDPEMEPEWIGVLVLEMGDLGPNHICNYVT